MDGGVRIGATTLSTMSDAVLAVERELGLLERTIDGVALWERIRFHVHRSLLVQAGVMGSPEPDTSRRMGWVAARVRALRASLFRSAFHDPPSCDLLFAGGGRRVLDPEWGWYSPYCGLLAHECSRESLVVEFQRGPWSLAAPGVATRFLDHVHLRALVRRVTGRGRSVCAEGRALLQEVGRRLRRETGVSLDLASMAREELIRRDAALPLYRRLLRECGARVVVVECSYDKHTLVEAARASELPVVEIQHGVVSRYHLGYHFPSGSGKPTTFPDWFFAWGEFWRSAAEFPIERERVVPVGFPRFDRERSQPPDASYDATHGGGEDILFLSQAMLGERISRFAARLAGLGLRDRIVYRLHPREARSWRTRYPWLVASGVRVTGSDASLYSQLRSVPIHVGCFSTALYEGLSLGGRTYLIRAPGVEYMDELVRAGKATLVQTPEELASLIGDVTDPVGGEVDTGQQFFRPGSLSRARAALRALLAGRSPLDAPDI